jgi:hypothetical protein
MPSGRYLQRLTSWEKAWTYAIKTRNGRKEQRFYFDFKTKAIKERRNNQGINIEGNGGSRSIRSRNVNGQWWQQWKADGAHIVNARNGLALDVAGNKDAEMQSVIVHPKHNGANQKWRIVYCHNIKDRTKGMNKQFGFFINRPFYLESQLALNRVLTNYGNAHQVIQTLNRNDIRQLYFFDEVSKTIRMKQYAYAITITG